MVGMASTPFFSFLSLVAAPGLQIRLTPYSLDRAWGIRTSSKYPLPTFHLDNYYEVNISSRSRGRRKKSRSGSLTWSHLDWPLDLNQDEEE